MAKVTANTKSFTVHSLLRENIAVGVNIMTDEYRSYSNIKYLGFKHKTIEHGQNEWLRGDIHINTIEGFLS